MDGMSEWMDGMSEWNGMNVFIMHCTY